MATDTLTKHLFAFDYHFYPAHAHVTLQFFIIRKMYYRHAF